MEAATDQPPDVCLLDLVMSGMSRTDGRTRAGGAGRNRSLVLVPVTAHSDPGSRPRTAAAGFDFHLVKPVQAEGLLVITLALRNAVTPSPDLATADGLTPA